jgi:hypothetical protein
MMCRGARGSMHMNMNANTHVHIVICALLRKHTIWYRAETVPDLE